MGHHTWVHKVLLRGVHPQHCSALQGTTQHTLDLHCVTAYDGRQCDGTTRLCKAYAAACTERTKAFNHSDLATLQPLARTKVITVPVPLAYTATCAVLTQSMSSPTLAP